MNHRSEGQVLRIGETLVVPETSSVASPSPRLAGGFAANGLFIPPERVPFWPVSGYMQRLDGKLEGISIQTESSSYIRAIAEGQVVWSGPYRGFGQVVLVDVEGYIYLYGGSEDIFVNVGERIAAGSRIGRLGTGDPGGKEILYFSVFKDGRAVDVSKAPRG